MTIDLHALGDIPIVALTCWGEARGEGVEGRIAIACVVRNRVRAPGWWGEGYTGVCLAEKQFSCWNANDPNRWKMLALAANPDHWFDNLLLSECRWIAEGIVGGRVTDRVGQATHYCRYDLSPLPAWTHGLTPVARIGSHLFYSGVK